MIPSTLCHQLTPDLGPDRCVGFAEDLNMAEMSGVGGAGGVAGVTYHLCQPDLNQTVLTPPPTPGSSLAPQGERILILLFSTVLFYNLNC